MSYLGNQPKTASVDNVTATLTNKTINLTSNTFVTTKAQLDTAVSDGNVCFDGDAATNLTMSTARILGRSTASTGAVEEITVGSGLSLSGGTLTSSAATTFASSAENAAGTIENKAVDPLGIREAFNATGSAPVYACRAWVNFNGTDTVAIRASGNVSSITDNGTGNYTVSFTTAMSDENYAWELNGRVDTTGGASVPGNYLSAYRSTTSVQTGSLQFFIGAGGSLTDWESVTVAIFR